MFFLILRLFAIAVLIYFGTQLLKKLLPKGDSVKCVRCDGKGYWMGTRERHKCEICNGAGKIYYEEMEEM